MKPYLFLLLSVTFTSCMKEKSETKQVTNTDSIHKTSETKAETITANEKSIEFNYATETLGGWLKIGVDEKTIKAKLGEDCKLSVLGESQVSGFYEEEWLFAKQGIKLIMESENPESQKTVAQFSVMAPSKLKTLKGIGIGSTKAEILSAYHGHINTEEATDDTIIVGSIYEGLFFTMKKDIVEEMFIGAIAE